MAYLFSYFELKDKYKIKKLLYRYSKVKQATFSDNNQQHFSGNSKKLKYPYTELGNHKGLPLRAIAMTIKNGKL